MGTIRALRPTPPVWRYETMFSPMQSREASYASPIIDVINRRNGTLQYLLHRREVLYIDALISPGGCNNSLIRTTQVAVTQLHLT